MDLGAGGNLWAGHGNAGLAKEVPKAGRLVACLPACEGLKRHRAELSDEAFNIHEPSWRLRDHLQHASLITSL